MEIPEQFRNLEEIEAEKIRQMVELGFIFVTQKTIRGEALEALHEALSGDNPIRIRLNGCLIAGDLDFTKGQSVGVDEVEELSQELKERLNEKRTEKVILIKCPLDVAESFIAGRVLAEIVEPTISVAFPEIRFSGTTLASDCIFLGATFCEIASFANSSFSKGTSFIGAIFGRGANFMEVSFGDKTSFYGATFGEEAYFVRASFGEATSFKSATFGERASFALASFGEDSSFSNATFGANVNFWNATFQKNISFLSTTFGKGTDFSHATFGNNACFENASFAQGTSFQLATFGQGTNFKRTIFGEATSFWHSNFGNETSFAGATFREWISFNHTTFGRKVLFKNVTFGEKISFMQAKFGEDAHFRDSFLQKGIFVLAKLKKADFQDAILEEANFFGANLQEAKLGKSILTGATLASANLHKANLQEASLERADFRRTNLKEADLKDTDWTDTDFRGANLKGAELSGITRFSGVKLGGANLNGLELPKGIREYEGLDAVAEASKNTRKIFHLILLGCAYSLLTIFSTKDARLLTNSSTSPLPIIQTGVPIAGFFLVAPAILTGIYLYFHICLQRLWEGLAKLPAVFTDGRSLNERAYPWLLNGLVLSHFHLLRLEDRPLMSSLQTLLANFLAWYLVPITLLLFWGRYIPKHDWVGTIIHIVILATSIGFGTLSYFFARATLRGKDWEPFDWKSDDGFEFYKRVAAALLSLIVFTVVSVGAINGIPTKSVQGHKIEGTNIWTWVPIVFEFIRWRTYADFEEVDVSIKPANWGGGEDEKEFEKVKGARLYSRDLRYAKAGKAFLANADLRRANLRGAELWEADLQKAKLNRANLKGANLKWTVLWKTNLQGADLREVKDLTASQLRDANNWALAFYDYEFLIKHEKELRLKPDHNTRVSSKKLSNCDLGGAKLVGANLASFNLQEANLKEANLLGADLRQSNLRSTNLQKAILKDADLQTADLRGADLKEANLEWAELWKANLKGADLSKSIGIIPAQLQAALNWDLAFFGDDFLKKYGKELGLPPNQDEHREMVMKRIAELEKE